MERGTEGREQILQVVDEKKKRRGIRKGGKGRTGEKK